MTELLSEDVWAIVLRHVPLSERLGSCALVCRTFAAAAVAATEDITATFPEQWAVGNLLEYLNQHGSHVTSITATWRGVSDRGVLYELPSCQHLQELSLSCFSMLQDPQQRVFNTVTGLTRLELDKSWLDLNPRGSFSSLSVLVNLQHLSVVCRDYVRHPEPCTLSGIGWSTMQHLTQLALDWVALEAEDLQHISSMSRLEVLKFHCVVHLTPDIAPGFCLPASLRELDLDLVVLDVSVLAAATHLTRLVLVNVTVCAEGGVSGGEGLLQLLAALQQLEVLSLQDLRNAWPPPSPAYQGVTASSKLRALAWRDCPLQPGVFAHMFPATDEHHCELRKLQDFTFVDNEAACDPADVARLVSKCQGLQRLELGVEAGPHLTTLVQLSALTTLLLDIDADDSSTAMSIQSLAGVTGLRELELVLRQPNTGASPGLLLPLTALRQLDVLFWDDQALRCSHLHLHTLAGPGEPPDVWLQLLERCAADSDCQPAIIRNLAQQLLEREAINSQQQEQEQQLTDLQQQLAEQEHINSQQQQDLADLRQQLVEQQQLNAALQEQVAGHGAQLQALEAKFQQLLRL